MPQKYVTVDGVATLIHHRGPTTLPGSPPSTDQGATVLCCHDAGTDGNQFADLMDHLATAHSPIAYDQPGHGRSATLDSLGSIEAMVAHLRGLSEAWSIENPILVGEGMGAAVALQACVTHPGWAAGLVLVGGAAASYEMGDEIESLSAITSGKARREFDRSGYAPDTDRAVYQKAFANWVKTDPRATLGDRKAQAAWSLDQPPDVPVTVVVGEHEEPDHVSAAEALATKLPNGSVERLAGAGRRGVLEQPGGLASMVSALAASSGAANGNGGRA
ncbi:MAG: alpha/beta fold hydrolase [Actinomycetia bacterium]|nr:alpha/beta fold hydrolase [Actinomycetes bacterium]